MPGVYLSFPFCAQKCTYCNFASGVFPAGLEHLYLQALTAEIRGQQWQWTPETVYIGGGTPSRLEPEKLHSLLSAIPSRPWREATIEVAPGDVTSEKAAAWRDAGFSRVSFGVQSRHTRELAQTGRRHTAETVEREVAIVRAAGIENINLDLIAGLPHQTVASFTASLEWVAALNVPHVSVYMLEVDEDSRLGNELILGGGRYGVGHMPSEQDIVEMYNLAVYELARSRIPRYEISNFARPGWESVHNLKYWRLEPYVGFGADAHSFDGKLRYQNVETAKEYVERWQSGRAMRSGETPADLTGERLLVGLRLAEGVAVSDAEWALHQAGLRRFLDDGLLEYGNGRLRLSHQGVLFSNEIFQEFVHS
ncbi:MAG: radical SAM family heme chaperone HemW [Acidobacteria bacterium]|nr:radical SAM family heme chaperone HemW [Acidobacteriota bacterium]